MSYSFHRNIDEARAVVPVGTKRRFRLASQDDFVFDVDLGLLKGSQILKTMFNDLGEMENPENGVSYNGLMNTEPIVLPFSGYDIQQALDCLACSKDIPSSMIIEDILTMWRIGNFLACDELKSKATAAFGPHLMTPDLESVRRRFDIKCDFKAVELKQMKCEGLDEDDEQDAS